MHTDQGRFSPEQSSVCTSSVRDMADPSKFLKQSTHWKWSDELLTKNWISTAGLKCDAWDLLFLRWQCLCSNALAAEKIFLFCFPTSTNTDPYNQMCYCHCLPSSICLCWFTFSYKFQTSSNRFVCIWNMSFVISNYYLLPVQIPYKSYYSPGSIYDKLSKYIPMKYRNCFLH
jgi:hypothetical protein